MSSTLWEKGQLPRVSGPDGGLRAHLHGHGNWRRRAARAPTPHGRLPRPHGSGHPPAARALHGAGGGRAPTAAVGALRSPAVVASGQLPARLAAHALRGGGGRLPGILSTPGFLSEK